MEKARQLGDLVDDLVDASAANEEGPIGSNLEAVAVDSKDNSLAIGSSDLGLTCRRTGV